MIEDEFLEEYSELILDVYSAIYPEEYHSDFTIEDVYNNTDIEDFVYDYMQNEYENWRLKKC